MDARSNGSISDATELTDCSSSHSNDDIELTFANFENVKFVTTIPGYSSENSSSSLPSPFIPSPLTLESRHDKLEDPHAMSASTDASVLDYTGKANYSKDNCASENGMSIPGTYNELVLASENGELKEGDSQPLFHGESIEHSTFEKYFKKVWLRVIFVAIFVFAGALIFWHLSYSPPPLPLIQSRVFDLPAFLTSQGSNEPTIHVNRTTREIRMTMQKGTDTFTTFRFTQSFSPLGNESFFPNSQEMKCSRHVDENVVCCRIRGVGSKCFLKDGNTIRNHTVNANAEVLDVENHQGRVHILKLIRHPFPRPDEFVLFDGVRDRTVWVNAPLSFDLKHAFLQNGTIYSVHESQTSCDQVICIDEECTPVHSPQCGLERIYATLPAHSIIMMHSSTARKDRLYTQLLCTLSQLSLPSLKTVAKSAPFKYTRAFDEDQLIYGFADYANPGLFHMNQLRFREDSRWEVVVSSYRLLPL